MLKINNIFIVLLMVFISSLTSANILKIIDGDTIHIGKIKYRLYGIDAPEIKQECKRNESGPRQNGSFYQSQKRGNTFKRIYQESRR